MRCLTPSLIQRADGFKINVPCGHCVHCYRNRQSAWKLRIVLEARSTEQSSFITLTYNENNLPESLDYRHIQLFLKRLRKSTLGPVRFFCCGEYGKRTERPHWHLVLFRIPPRELEGRLTELWPHGFFQVSELNGNRAAYVAKYCLKTGPSGEKFNVQMSRRPGIGLDGFREIGAYLASKADRLAAVPRYWRLGGSLCPLDKSSRNALLEGYVDAGGVAPEKKSDLLLDAQARCYALIGDLTRDRCVNAIGLERVRREEGERHGTL